MNCAQKKIEQLYIPVRDKTQVAKAKPALGRMANHQKQVSCAFDLVFSKYESALKELSKV